MAGEWQPSLSEAGWRPQVRRDLRFLFLVRRNQRLHIAFLLIQQASVIDGSGTLENTTSRSVVFGGAILFRHGKVPIPSVAETLLSSQSNNRINGSSLAGWQPARNECNGE
ncbi:MAG: hypothetical protein QOI94_571 [Acidobacteriaceae bacterium]|nr:hypothetical protein [Acidobacteriaceae bacterium]